MEDVPEEARPAPRPSRFFWSRSWDSPWWKPLILAGIRGGDEWCNRTIGLRLPGGALFACLNVPLRRTACGQCVADHRHHHLAIGGHVCKPGAHLYWCPTAAGIESSCHGGFDTCCDRPDLHQPIQPLA